MKPIEFEGANKAYISPKNWDDEAHGKCGDLYTFEGETNGLNVILSAWQPTEEDIARIVAGSPIYLQVVGTVMPPVALTMDYPLEKTEPTAKESTGMSFAEWSRAIGETFSEMFVLSHAGGNLFMKQFSSLVADLWKRGVSPEASVDKILNSPIYHVLRLQSTPIKMAIQRNVGKDWISITVKEFLQVRSDDIRMHKFIGESGAKEFSRVKKDFIKSKPCSST